MPLKEEHVSLLKKQMDLVHQLKEVVASQQRALEQLGSVDEDYENAPTKDAAGYDSDNEGELQQLAEDASNAESRRRPDNSVDDQEKAEPNVNWEEPDEETERGFMATKPWLGAMAPPSDWSWDASKERDAAPSQQLVLEHVHGYRARSCRNNAFWVDANTVVYPAAGVCVVMNVSTKEQKFFRGHDDDVVCLDYNPTKRVVASGQLGRDAKICVWSIDEPEQTLATFSGHKRAVVSVSISPDGSRVASVGLDNDHSIMIHDINGKKKLVHSKGDTNRIVQIQWNTTSAADSSNELVTVGSKHIIFWTVAGGSLSKKKGLLGRKGEYQSFLCAGFTPEYTLVACENGSLYCFESNKLKKIVDAHNGAVFSVATHPETNRIVTGGRDGFVNVWDRKTMKNLVTFDMNNEDPCSGLNSVKSLYMDAAHADTILVGTITSSLYEVNTSAFKAKKLFQNHFGDLSKKSSYGELWGLATHPSSSRVATAGEDGTIRVWNTESKEQVNRIETGEKGVCAAYSNNGAYIAVGNQNGSFAVYNTKNNFLVGRIKNTKKRIQCISFSPDDSSIAVGGANNRVYIYAFEDEDISAKVKCTGNSSVILSVDWSADGKYIQTCSQSYELLYFDAETGKQHTKSRELKDTNWKTFSSILGWSVQGIWPKEADGSDINNVNVSNGKKLLASAEDSGNVKLFQYPCVGSGLDRRGKLNRRPESSASLAHSSHVTRVAFTHDDKHVLSSGGADNCVMQWRLE